MHTFMTTPATNFVVPADIIAVYPTHTKPLGTRIQLTIGTNVQSAGIKRTAQRMRLITLVIPPVISADILAPQPTPTKQRGKKIQTSIGKNAPFAETMGIRPPTAMTMPATPLVIPVDILAR